MQDQKNKINWKLDLKNAGISVGEAGEWDADMVCYPYVFQHKGKTYMLYNGNGNGKSGFGLARMDE